MDDRVFLCAGMVPPGVHYFYFVRSHGTIFLSPNYEVVRFKTTNVFLNRIEVSKRLEDFEYVHEAKDGEEEEAVFMKDRSVFKDYREDTQSFLLKCFESDFEFGKIPRTVKKGTDFDQEVAKIKELLFEHYVRIINIFTFYSGSSAYPTISMNDFTSFANTTKILDQEYIGLAALDLILVATAVSHHQYVNSATLDLTRYEFMEMIVRVANFRYKETKLVKTTCEAIEKVLSELIYPHAQAMNGEKFRKYHCYSVKVNEILKKNEQQLKRVYDSFTHAKKRYITVEECKTYVRKVGLSVSEMMVGAIYAESMMTIIDPIRDPVRPNMMKYVEFLVFLCRVAHEHYNGGPYENELLFLKLDHLMPAFLAFLSLQPQFLFGEKFKIEQEEEKRNANRKRKQIKRALKRQMTTGSPIDPKLLAEIKTLARTAKAGQVIPDSESDDELESEAEDTFNRETPVTSEVKLAAEELGGIVRNADLSADVGHSGPISVDSAASKRQDRDARAQTQEVIDEGREQEEDMNDGM